MLTMALGGAQGIELQTVVGVDIIGHAKIVGPGIGIGFVNDTLALLDDDRAVDGELVIDLAAGDTDGRL